MSMLEYRMYKFLWWFCPVSVNKMKHNPPWPVWHFHTINLCFSSVQHYLPYLPSTVETGDSEKIQAMQTYTVPSKRSELRLNGQMLCKWVVARLCKQDFGVCLFGLVSKIWEGCTSQSIFCACKKSTFTGFHKDEVPHGNLVAPQNHPFLSLIFLQKALCASISWLCGSDSLGWGQEDPQELAPGDPEQPPIWAGFGHPFPGAEGMQEQCIPGSRSCQTRCRVISKIYELRRHVVICQFMPVNVVLHRAGPGLSSATVKVCPFASILINTFNQKKVVQYSPK